MIRMMTLNHLLNFKIKNVYKNKIRSLLISILFNLSNHWKFNLKKLKNLNNQKILIMKNKINHSLNLKNKKSIQELLILILIR